MITLSRLIPVSSQSLHALADANTSIVQLIRLCLCTLISHWLCKFFSWLVTVSAWFPGYPQNYDQSHRYLDKSFSYYINFDNRGVISLMYLWHRLRGCTAGSCSVIWPPSKKDVISQGRNVWYQSVSETQGMERQRHRHMIIASLWGTHPTPCLCRIPKYSR
jgi:hypothetical protein